VTLGGNLPVNDFCSDEKQKSGSQAGETVPLSLTSRLGGYIVAWKLKLPKERERERERERESKYLANISIKL
jgi:hypothetical protein